MGIPAAPSKESSNIGAYSRGLSATSAVRVILFQDNASDDWLMPIPLVLKFAGGRIERRTVLARGARRDVVLMLVERPESVELDPDLWVLSEKTSTRKR